MADASRGVYVGRTLLEASGTSRMFPDPDAPPFLYCGNGSCGGCDLLVDGHENLPGCRIPFVSGVSLRLGEGAGEPNALSRELGHGHGEIAGVIATPIALVGGGDTGSRMANALSSTPALPALGVSWFEARPWPALSGLRAATPRPCGVHDGALVVHIEGLMFRVRASATVLAVGSQSRWPRIVGAATPGVVTLDTMDSLLTHDSHPFVRAAPVLVCGEGASSRRVARRLVSVGARPILIDSTRRIQALHGVERLEAATIRASDDSHTRRIEASWMAVETERAPRVGIARALGCRVAYDRKRDQDRVWTDDRTFETSVPGVFVAPGRHSSHEDDGSGLAPMLARIRQCVVGTSTNRSVR